MARFKIISKDGSSVKYEGKLRYIGSYLKPSYVEFSEISSPTPINWEIGDYVDYSRTGMRYRLFSVPQVVKNARAGSHGNAFSYTNVQFFAATKELEIALFRDLVSGDNNIHFSTSPDVATFEDVAGIARRIQACMDDLYPGRWEIRVADFDAEADAVVIEKITTAKDFALSGGTCLDALSKIYELWQDIGWIHSYDPTREKDIITIGYANKRIDANTTDAFLYGKGNGLTAIKKSQANKDEFATRLYVYGSERNLPSRYYNDKDILNAESVDIRNLMLPMDVWGKTDGKPDARKAYIENAEAVAKIGVIPRVHYFDSDESGADIYPSIEGMTVGMLRKVLSDMGDTAYSPSYSVYTDASERVDEVGGVISLPADEGKISEITQLTTIAIPSYSKEKNTGIVDTIDLIENHILYEGLIESSFEMGEITVRPSVECTVTNADFSSVIATLTLDDSLGASTSSPSKTISTPAEYDESRNLWVLPLKDISVKYDKKSSANGFYIYLYISISATKNNPGVGSDAIASVLGGKADIEVKQILSKTFNLRLKQLGFNLNLQGDLGKGKTISLKTGKCAGRNFIISSAKYNPGADSWDITCKRQQDETLGLLFPNTNYEIQTGDRFVILDIVMPESYIRVAMERLLAEGQRLFNQVSTVRSNYEPSIDAKLMAESGRHLREGMFMEISDSDIVDNTTEHILIDTLSIYEDESAIPTYKVTLRERRKVTYKGTPSAAATTKTSSVEDGETDMSEYAKTAYVDKKDKEFSSTLSKILDWFTLEDGVLLTKYNLASEKEVSAKGINASQGGGTSYNRLDSWSAYDSSKAGYVLSALLGYDLHSRVTTLENAEVDLSDYYTKSQTNSQIASAIGAIDLSPYATKEALNTLEGKHNTLRNEFDALSNLLSSDTTDYINTWNEVVAFLDGYKDESDLATILSGMNADISSRLLTSTFDSWKADTYTPLASLVANHTTRLDGIDQSILSINTRIDGVDKTIEDHIAEFIAFRANFEITDNLILVRKNFASTEEVSAKGINQGTGGGGGSSYSRLDTWEGYDNNKAGYVLSAGLGYGLKVAIDELNGYDLDNRVRSIENSYVSKDAGGVVNGGLVVSSLAVSGGSSSQFLKADGSLDGTSYLSTSGGTINGYFGAFSVKRFEPYASAIKFENSVGILGYIGINDDYTPLIWDKDLNTRTLLHSGNIGSYALTLDGGYLNNNRGIAWHNNVCPWDEVGDGLIGVSNLTAPLGYYAGLSFKAFYGLQIRAYGGDTDFLEIRGYNAVKWGNWRKIIHSGNVGDYALKTDGNNTMLNNLQLGKYSIIYNTSNDASWTNPQNSGLRILNAIHAIPTEGNIAYGVGLSVSGYYGFQLSSDAGTHNFYYRATSTGVDTGDWKTIAFTDSDITGYSAGLKHSNGTVGATVNERGQILSSGYGVAATNGNWQLLTAGYSGDFGTTNSDGVELYSLNGVLLSVGGKGLTLNSYGNVTIGEGDLASSSYRLYVDGDASFDGYLRTNKIYLNRVSDGVEAFEISNIANTSGLAIKALGGSGFISFWNNSGNGVVEQMRIAGGNVGIGTSEPYCLLEVASEYKNINKTSIASAAMFAVGRHNNDSLFFGYDDTSGAAWMQSAYYGTTEYPSNLYTRSLLLNPLGGNIGIGTSSPSYKLDVIGDIRATESITIGGATLSWENGALKVNTSFYSEKEISAKGLSTGGGSGASYNRLDTWGDYDSSKSGYVLSALLGYDLNSRLTTVESNYLSKNNGVATNLTVYGGTINGDFIIDRSISTILYYKDGVRLGFMGFRDELEPIIYDAAGHYSYDILHSGNIGDYALSTSGGILNGSLQIGKDDNTAYNYLRLVRDGYEMYVNCNSYGGYMSYGAIGSESIGQLRLLANAIIFNGNTLIHSGNIGSQSVAYATNATYAWSANTLDGYLRCNNGDGTSWGRIPSIGNDGVMDIGKYIDFRNDSSLHDYSTRLMCTGKYANTVNLPSASGTLALTTDNVASATKLATPRTIWGQSFDGTGDVGGNLSDVTYLTIRDYDYGIYKGNYFGSLAASDIVFTAPNLYFYTSRFSMLINSSGNVTIGAGDLAGTSTKLYVDGDTTINGSLSAGATTLSSLTVSGATEIRSDLRLKPSSSNHGSYLKFGDGSYCYLHEDTDDHLKIYADKGVTIANATTIDGDLSVSTINGYTPITSGNIGSQSVKYATSAGSASASDVYDWAKKASLAASDVPNLDWSKITTGKPTTLSGYGIADAYTKIEVNDIASKYLLLEGGTVSGATTFTGGIATNDIHGNGQTLYLGNPSNNAYIKVRENMQGSSSMWSIPRNGKAVFTSLKSDTSLEVVGDATAKRLIVGTDGMLCNGPATFNDFIYGSSITPKTDNYYVLGNNNYKWYAVTAYNVNVHDAITIEAGKELRFKDNNGVVHTLKYDSAKQAFVFDGNVNATGEMSAKKLNA